MGILITVSIIFLIIASIYYFLYKIPLKEINKKTDAAIKKEPHKKELFNMIRYYNTYRTAKAEESFKKYLKQKIEEELMWMDKENKK